jgi:hypothetical protein
VESGFWSGSGCRNRSRSRRRALSTTPQTQASFPLFTLGVVSIAIFDTALYLRAGANLLLAIFVHLLANVCGGIALDGQALNFFFVAEGIAAAVVVVVGGLRSTGQLAPITPDAALA